MAEQGNLFPDIITLGITVVFTVFGFYALSANQSIKPLPYVKWVIIIIASIYTIRGLGGIPMYIFANYPAPLMLWSSLTSLTIGIFHIIGIKQHWKYLEIT